MSGAAAPTARAHGPSRVLGVATTAALLLASWGPALIGALLCLHSSGGIEAVGTLSAALAFGGAAALLPVRGGHGGRGGPLLPLTLATTGVGGGAATLAAGLRAAGVDRGLWLDLLGVAWMPGGLTVAGVLGAAVLLHARTLLAAGASLSTALAVSSAVELDRGTPLPFTAALWIVWLALALWSGATILWVARRRSSPDREAAVWLAIAHFALLLCGVGGFTVTTDGGGSLLGTAFAAAVLPACVLFAAASFVLTAIARAPDAVEPARARFAVGVLLVSALLAAYGAVAATIAQLAPLPPTSAGMVAVVLIAVGAEPVRRGVQRAVDQLLYGRSAEPRALLRTVSTEAGGGSGRASLEVLAEALRRSLRLGGVAIASSGPEHSRGQAGTLDPATREVVALLAAGGACGTVEVSGTAGRRVEPRSLAALRRIGGVLSVAVLLADADEGLRVARDGARRIAASERRFARGEIEAGLEPVLVRVRGALRALPHSPRPDLVLREASAALQAATTEVRDLARTLLPGALDAGDLTGALTELAARFPEPVLHAEVRRAPEHPEHLYHLVAEAMLRARREGGVERIEVTVGPADRAVLRVVGAAVRVDPIVRALHARVAERVPGEEPTGRRAVTVTAVPA
ncbi:hypothetical protein [Microbacterium sufflavum]|uniref:Uncharacterized protein n=2 Tax=Microbacterium TaxID=33882 RepID=A0ABY4IH83_9MICO|nr:hypothetical protein [Microbacterium sufflavum]UPL10883.1 hypothetical protein KV394_07090 [Microbacterium sufflavum]